MAWMPACAAGAGVSKSGSPTPRSRTSSPAAFRRLASLLIATVSDALRCWMLGDSGSVMSSFRIGVEREVGGKVGHRIGDVNRPIGGVGSHPRSPYLAGDFPLSERGIRGRVGRAA